MNKELEQFFLENEYFCLKEIDGQVIGLQQFMFTTGLVVKLDRTGYERRYCYENEMDARLALSEWDGKNHPPGNWIKVKGAYKGKPIDELNPNLTA